MKISVLVLVMLIAMQLVLAALIVYAVLVENDPLLLTVTAAAVFVQLLGGIGAIIDSYRRGEK